MSRESRSLPPGWVCAALSRIVPWFLGRQDRETLRVVADDLREDAQVRMFRGASAAEARKWQRQHLWEETKLFVGRGARRQGRVAASVGACGLVVVLGAFFVSELWGAPRRIDEVQRRLAEAWAVLEAGGPGASRPDVTVLPELQDLETLIGEEASSNEDESRTAVLAAWLAQVFEAQAFFWEAYGAESVAVELRERAFDQFKTSANGGNLLGLFEASVQHLDRGEEREALAYLRVLDGNSPGFTQGATPTHDMATARLHYTLWKCLEQDSADPTQLISEAWEIEERALRAMSDGRASEYVHYIAYNAACLRALLVGGGALNPSHAVVAIERLKVALATAGDERESTMLTILEDPDLASLRSLPGFLESLQQVAPESHSPPRFHKVGR